MRRSPLLVVAALIAIVFIPSVARANGGATFDFGDQAYLLSGEEIQGTTVVWLGKKDVRALQGGPYYAYLVPDGKWIKPPNIPAGAIRVGTVDFRTISEKKAEATLSFVAPDLPSGRYALPYCNDPCTRASVGDLYVDSVLIARDAEVGALLVRNEHAEAKAASFEWRIERAQRQMARLETAAGSAQQEAANLRGDLAVLRLRATGEADDPGLTPWVGMAAAGMAAGYLIARLRRRRTPASPVVEAERILERVG